jgi:hypothetical protein
MSTSSPTGDRTPSVGDEHTLQPMATSAEAASTASKHDEKKTIESDDSSARAQGGTASKPMDKPTSRASRLSRNALESVASFLPLADLVPASRISHGGALNLTGGSTGSRGTGHHFTPYYPHSPLHHNTASAGAQGSNSGSALDAARHFLSGVSSPSTHPPHARNRPPMPAPEDVLALFRESLAALPKPFSTYIEASVHEAPPHAQAAGASATSAAGRVVRTEDTPWSALYPCPSSLQSRLSLAQEQTLLALLLAEIHAESELNFAASFLQHLGRGRGAAAGWMGQAAALEPQQRHREAQSFDLMDIYSFLDADSDGFLTCE